MIASVKTTQRRFTMVSEIQIKIRGYHVDHFGHVNNGKYYGFFEEGRWSYFDDKPELLDYFHTNELMHVVALKSVIDVLALVN
jgi:thioesterase-3